jgi:thiol-disulfide isomerase/thioredoxin
MTQLLLFIFFLSGWLSPVNQGSDEEVVRAVLFYSPSCGHCHYVIQEVLPPLFEKYGDQLQIFSVDVSQPGAYELFEAALEPWLRDSGVPALFVGDQMMMAPSLGNSAADRPVPGGAG